MNFYTYRPNGNMAPSADEFSITELAAEVVEHRQNQMD